MEEYLDGNLELGDYVVKMDFNVKTSNSYTGSFIGIDILAGKTENFYQDYYLDLVLIEMPAQLELRLANLENKTDYILASLEWSKLAIYR